ncbi:hypothetical protein [Streptomyces sp. NPDC002845]
MDTEVAMKIVEQFPEFRKFATDAFGAIEKAHEATLADGMHSLDQVYQALRENREIFERELRRDDLTWEQRKHLLELIQETARLASQKGHRAQAPRGRSAEEDHSRCRFRARSGCGLRRRPDPGPRQGRTR